MVSVLEDTLDLLGLLPGGWKEGRDAGLKMTEQRKMEALLQFTDMFGESTMHQRNDTVKTLCSLHDFTNQNHLSRNKSTASGVINGSVELSRFPVAIAFEKIDQAEWIQYCRDVAVSHRSPVMTCYMESHMARYTARMAASSDKQFRL